MNAVAAFAHGGIGQADDGKVGVAAYNIYFDFNGVGFEADDGTTEDFGEHTSSLFAVLLPRTAVKVYPSPLIRTK